MNMATCYSYIRFSSLAQADNDSLRRQMRLSDEYAQKKGLLIDSSLALKDLGVSAFNRDNITKGALGKFIELVGEGKIEKGSILLVESLDRLSRAKIDEAMLQFLTLVNAGVTVVTLQDGMEYSKETVGENSGQLLISLTIMSRAYEESRIKSDRVASAWKSKRDIASNQKITANCPSYLSLDKEKNVFYVIEGCDVILRKIFAMYLDGFGTGAIAHALNKKGIMPFGKRCKSGWQPSFIWKLLRSRTVLGEYQPHKLDSAKKRVPAGEPIENYYPQIIDEETFLRVQKLLGVNSKSFGKIGNVGSLFSHIARCGVCGASMAFVNKGKGVQYFVCDQARRGGSCSYRTIKYDEFEKAFLRICTQLNLGDILSETQDQNKKKINALAGELVVCQSKIEGLSKKIENWLDAIGEGDTMKKLLTPKIEEADASREELERKKTVIKKELQKLENLHAETESKLVATKEAITQMSQMQGDDLIQARLKVRSKIRQMVDRVDVYVEGRAKKTAMQAISTNPDMPEDLLQHFKGIIENATREDRGFVVKFKGGGASYVAFAPDTGRYELMVDIAADPYTMTKGRYLKLLLDEGGKPSTT